MNFTSLLHSVSYSGSWGQPALTIEQFLSKAAELGFDGVGRETDLTGVWDGGTAGGDNDWGVVKVKATSHYLPVF